MKKIVVWTLFLGLVCASAFAMNPEEAKKAHYQEMKKIKEQQRAGHEADKTGAPATATKKEPGFWEKEGERSGLGGNSSRFSTFFSNLNPVPFFKKQQEDYNARKAASGAYHASEQAKVQASEQSAVAATK